MLGLYLASARMLPAGIANTNVSESGQHLSNFIYIVVFSFSLGKYLALFCINIALRNAYIINVDRDYFVLVCILQTS